jgi:hypothetical protein
MQELDSTVMVTIREHGHISPHGFHDHHEMMKHGIYGLTGVMSEVLVLSPVGRKEPSLNLSIPGMMLTVKIRQPSHEFTFGVGISFIPYPLVLTPVI